MKAPGSHRRIGSLLRSTASCDGQQLARMDGKGFVRPYVDTGFRHLQHPIRHVSQIGGDHHRVEVGLFEQVG